MQCACVILCTHLWPAPLYSIFPHYLINCTIFEKRLLNTKCVYWYPVQRLFETFLIIRENERDMIKNVNRSSCKVTVITARCILNLNVLDICCERYSNAKFHEYSSSGSWVVPCGHLKGRADRNNEHKSRYSEFCEGAGKFWWFADRASQYNISNYPI